MIDFFGTRKRKFKSWLEDEIQQGLVMQQDTNGHWFIYLSSNLDELLEDQSFVIRLSTDMKGVVCRANLALNLEANSMLIGDIKSNVENRGYGSLVLKNIIKQAKEIGVKEVVGNLSKIDSDHFDKLEYFYSKHGFDVSFYNSRTEGRIVLNLNRNL